VPVLSTLPSASDSLLAAASRLMPIHFEYSRGAASAPGVPIRKPRRVARLAITKSYFRHISLETQHDMGNVGFISDGCRPHWAGSFPSAFGVG
jgi:hypothetical protein